MGKSDALSRRADHAGSSDNEQHDPLTPDLFAIRTLEGIEILRREGHLEGDPTSDRDRRYGRGSSKSSQIAPHHFC